MDVGGEKICNFMKKNNAALWEETSKNQDVEGRGKRSAGKQLSS